MKNTIGNSVALTIFGESHGEAVGVVLDGLASGITVDEVEIAKLLSKRRPNGITDTKRIEKDEFKILSGVFNGKTTGTPICIVIPNQNTISKDYDANLLRPSHADFVANEKYAGYQDYRGGGHFSGRVTAGIVAVGAILKSALKDIGINLGSHILSCEDQKDREFADFEKDFDALSRLDFPVLDQNSSQKMQEKILQARNDCDSVGGIIQTAVTGMPVGVGEPWFDSVEGMLSHALFSIGGVKGVEFGLGFNFADKRASQVNDAFILDGDKIITKTNNNGGINGGITNGMPIVFNCAVKPTPSISKTQQTVDLTSKTQTEINISGRHDPAIVRRICPVIESVTALVICDLLAVKFGTDYIRNGK